MVLKVIEQLAVGSVPEQTSPVLAETVTVPVGAVAFVDPTTL